MQIEDSVIAHFLFGCHVGNFASVKRNLDPAELSNTKDDDGNTGLVLAAEIGHVEIVKFLLNVDESSGHLNALNKDGRSALMVAADCKRIDVVKEILKHENVDKDIRDRWGMTAVDIGNVRRQAEIVEVLGGSLKREMPIKVKRRCKTVNNCNTQISNFISLPSLEKKKTYTSCNSLIRPEQKKTDNKWNTQISNFVSLPSPKVNQEHKQESRMDMTLENLGARPKTIKTKTMKNANSLESLLDTKSQAEMETPNLELLKHNFDASLVLLTRPSTEIESDPTESSDEPDSPGIDENHTNAVSNNAHDLQIGGQEIEQEDLDHEISFENIQNTIENNVSMPADLEQTVVEDIVDDLGLDQIFWEHEDIEKGGEITTTNINNDLISEVRKNILAKIDEYNEKIGEEESNFMAMKDLLLKKKKAKTMLVTEINKEKKEFYERIRKEKEIFEKKQENEMNEFWEHIRSRQEKLQKDFEAEEVGIEAKEQRVENFRNIVQVLVTRLSSISELNLLSGEKQRSLRHKSVTISEMECPVCLEKMAPPKRIFQCRQGHAICGNCFERPQVKKCPTCRGAFIGRATVLEKVAATLFSQSRL
eukprot:GFUD01027967.1.p1 GENE.GFUD01027967.1~~GFUD01027967.1.p1  ORF type:complete len:592 (+),score=185.21 GFUD01027967.1:32-1807(+)